MYPVGFPCGLLHDLSALSTQQGGYVRATNLYYYYYYDVANLLKPNMLPLKQSPNPNSFFHYLSDKTQTVFTSQFVFFWYGHARISIITIVA